MTVDRFIACENIKHFQEMLLSDDIRPDVRSRVHKLLVEEEDKLGKDLELLERLERHITNGAQRIEAQRLRVVVMQRDGHDGLRDAQALLDGFIETQSLFLTYRQRVAEEVERNRI
ncbi:hypothetical protein [Rhodoplanes sp. Z2-YC6860]|uniref:hypothetical protein n=1 Tax=Rhodoplanes sp. Z2-YC6860 TaxID=674703 RepID=UPI00082B0256|nr:hypothetical protein [Rhodoplanes sp. Z2-YC6860]